MKNKKLVMSLLLFVLLCLSSIALASGAAEEGGATGQADIVGVAIALGASFSIAVAAMGGAVGQGKAIASALEGISRNPGAAGKVMTPMIIGLAMIESLVIYALVIALMLVLKLK